MGSRLSNALAEKGFEAAHISFPKIKWESEESSGEKSGCTTSGEWSVNFKFLKEKFFKNGIPDSERCDKLIDMLKNLLLKYEIKCGNM
eukprot:557952-Amorphochlora_amoeboformis.AAC.1